MAFYDYKCTKCNERFEVEKSMNDTSAQTCPFCKSKKTSRIFTAFRRGASKSAGMDHEGHESSGTCSSCSSGVCSSCSTKGS